MKKTALLILLLTCFLMGKTQTVQYFSTRNVDKLGRLNLYADSIWQFSVGKDTANWEGVRTTLLTKEMAGKDGVVEGWFKLLFYLDSSFLKDPMEVMDINYAGAIRVYLNKKLIYAQGLDDKLTILNNFTAINIKPGQANELIIYVKDKVVDFPINDLRNNTARQDERIIELGSRKFLERETESLKALIFYYNLWLIALGLLTIFFWMVYLVNHKTSQFLLIALINSSLLVFFFIVYNLNIPSHTYDVIYIFSSLVGPVFDLTILLMLLGILDIFYKRKIRLLYTTLITLFLIQVTAGLFKVDIVNKVIYILYLLFIVWTLFKGRKQFKGAQWSIVIGILLSILFIELYRRTVFGDDLNRVYGYNIATGIALSFPLSCLVYIILRIREMMQDVEIKSFELVALKEEQRFQAEQQTKILEQEVARQTEEIRNSLLHLQRTQQQLVQSEKMASLGELTAGIAHEIQNPLNFVNNFSEVSNELVDEMNTELDKGDITEAKIIAADIKQNLEKIAHHGKRADSIVKGMLQHSRSSTGQKELTDINALCDEYLRLAYHGIRAKDSGFNAILETDFDNSIGSISIQPQEMGRVILNLINNALYAVGEKKNKGVQGFEPKVKITTQQKNGSIEISVEDNGMGIPEHVKEKIFQPFFTTKPTGQGTGLGLSLSYDIVKAHGGSLNVDSHENSGTIFTIIVPK